MKRLLLAAYCFAGLTGSALATQEDDEWARALEIPCHPLVTEAECRAHRDLLASLPDGAAKDAYLAKYIALLAERERSCGCSLANNGIGLLRYR